MKPKSKEEKIQDGTYRHDLDPGIQEPRNMGLPEAPEFIQKNPEALRIYNLMLEHVNAYKLLESIDFTLLAGFAKCWTLYCRYSDIVLNEENDTQTFESGAQQVSVYVTLMDKEELKLDRYYKSLGIGPANRDKIRSMLTKPKDQKDALGSLKKPKN